VAREDACGGVGPQADNDHAERSDGCKRQNDSCELGRAFEGKLRLVRDRAGSGSAHQQRARSPAPLDSKRRGRAVVGDVQSQMASTVSGTDLRTENRKVPAEIDWVLLGLQVVFDEIMSPADKLWCLQ